MCVARRGTIVLHDAWGVLGPEAGAPPLGLDSIFPIMSITKPITATLVMQLVEEGLLGLNRPVVDYLPEVTGEGVAEILVHHLLTHTSGYSWSWYGGSMALHAATKLEAGFEPPQCPAWRHPENHRELSILWDAPREAAAGELMIWTFVAFAEQILPKDDTPGATDAGAVYFADRALDGFAEKYPSPRYVAGPSAGRASRRRATTSHSSRGS